MIALILLGFFAIYFWVSFLIVKGTVGWAKKRGRSRWGWGFLSAFFMYNLVFWDVVPGRFMMLYYSKVEAGLIISSTPAMWLKEHPEDRLHKYEGTRFDFPESPDAWNNSEFSDLLVHSSRRINLAFNVHRMEIKLIDKATGEPILQYVDFSFGNCAAPRSIYDYRPFAKSCQGSKSQLLTRKKFYETLAEFERTIQGKN